MEYRTLGATGLRVSEIGFGCGNTAGLMVNGTREDQLAAVARALDLGINHFDTAARYGYRTSGYGASERNLAAALRQVGARPIIATKAAFLAEDLADIPGSVERSVTASIERLGIEPIDILYLHDRVDAERHLDGTVRLSLGDTLGPKGVLEAFERQRQAGRVRYLGFSASHGDPAVNRQIIDSGGFQVVETEYNIWEPTEARLPPPGFQGMDMGQTIPYSAARGMGIVVIRALGSGALGGAEEPHPLNTGGVRPEYFARAKKAQSLRFLEHPGEQTMAQAAIRFVLGNKDVSTALVGFSTVEHVEAAVAVSGKGGLSEEDMARIEQLYASDFGCT